ncbi:MAG: hypothetical protein JWL88_726 [Parcubacteria group bacterium]|nr:hypothetical protein [Parcubacteria group bacterium]
MSDYSNYDAERLAEGKRLHHWECLFSVMLAMSWVAMASFIVKLFFGGDGYARVEWYFAGSIIGAALWLALYLLANSAGDEWNHEILARDFTVEAARNRINLLKWWIFRWTPFTCFWIGIPWLIGRESFKWFKRREASHLAEHIDMEDLYGPPA